MKQAMTPEFKLYQRQVVANCRALAKALVELGYDIVTGTGGSGEPGAPLPLPPALECGQPVVT